MIELLASNTAAPVEGDRLFVDLLPWLGLILLLVTILIVTIYIGRRMVRGDDDVSDQPFTLQSLRDLHASGQLSDEEFQRARDAMIGRIKSTPEQSPEEQPFDSDSDDEPHETSAASDQLPSADDSRDNTHDRTRNQSGDHIDQDPSTDDTDERPRQSDNSDEEKPKGDRPR